MVRFLVMGYIYTSHREDEVRGTSKCVRPTTCCGAFTWVLQLLFFSFCSGVASYGYHEIGKKSGKRDLTQRNSNLMVDGNSFICINSKVWSQTIPS
jgi:hypothetical protein